MSRLQIVLVTLIIGVGIIYYFYNSPITTTVHVSKFSIFSLQSPPFILPPSAYQTIEIIHRDPPFMLATIDGDQPYSYGDRAREALVDSLQLVARCKQDPSLMVVDIGAVLGDFGLYAAACGCQVLLFEVQSSMVDLIRTSIALNNFSTSRVHVLQRAVSDLPSNSEVAFSSRGDQISVSSDSHPVSTIRLDDIAWPSKSSILILKIDVEGYELNVLRSAEKLFGEGRIDHLIFEYTAWQINRAAQKDLIPFVEKTLGARHLFALDRIRTTVYGPLNKQALNHFYDFHMLRRLQTDVYATFIDTHGNFTLEVEPYYLGVSFA